jgi:hypothetical protein
MIRSLKRAFLWLKQDALMLVWKKISYKNVKKCTKSEICKLNSLIKRIGLPEEKSIKNSKNLYCSLSVFLDFLVKVSAVLPERSF